MAAPSPQATATNQATSGTSVTCNKPSGVVDGDLLIAVVSSRVAGNATHSGDTGWTQVNSQVTLGQNDLSVWRKIASSEGASYTFTLSSTARWCITIQRVTGAHATTPINASATNTTTGTGTLTCPDVTTTANDCLICRIAAQQGGSTGTRTAPGSTTQQWNTNEGGSTGHWQGNATSELASAGSAGTAAWSSDLTNNACEMTVAIAPASGGSQTFSGLGVAASTGSVVAPTLSPGQVSITPGNAVSTATAVAPTLTPGSVTITPGAAVSTVTAIAPTMSVAGLISVTDAATCATTAVPPTLTPGQATISPGTAVGIGAVIAPTLVASVAITPGTASALAAAVAPTMTAGQVSLSPGVCAGTCVVIAPSMQIVGGVVVIACVHVSDAALWTVAISDSPVWDAQATDEVC